jgi:putative DNA primase/helicase
MMFKCTDIGNRERFQDYYKERVRYIPEINKWVFFDKKGWRYAKYFVLTDTVVRNIYNEAAQCSKEEDRTTLGQWAKLSQSRGYQRNMLELASHFMATAIDEFDANPKLINCKNGILDLETQEILPHSATQLHLKQVKAAYLPDSTCPRWIKFLDEIFEGDHELIDWLQVAVGYSLMGLTTEHCFFLCYGNGRNGKGTFLETIRYVLGDYGHTAEFETFLQKDKSNVRMMEAVGNLKGNRFVIASETSDNTRMNEALIKRLTGGDTLVGTRLNVGSFEFNPTHTIWFACNHLPAIKDASTAMWDRVKAIPFGRRFLSEDQEKNLKDRLKHEECDGIFAWAVDGAYRYLKDGLPEDPEACKDATKEYRDDNDKLSIFIDECLQKEKGGSVGVNAVYTKYLEWCPGANESDPITQKYFSKSMVERGIKKKAQREADGYKFIGCRLKEDDENVGCVG